MKAKLSILFLLAFAIAMFCAGWVQFSVPAGKYGVLVSKTGGIDPDPIIPGKFRWQWERLLPTNARVVPFDLSPVTVTVSATGTLPSGELYSKMLEGDPDFSWSVTVVLSGRVEAGKLPALVRDMTITAQGGLDDWTKARLNSLGTDAINRVIADLASESAATGAPVNPVVPVGNPAAFADALRASLSIASAGQIEILECAPTVRKIPDMSLYSLAGSTYADYQSARRDLFAKTAAKEADSAVSEYLQIERFGRWGELLTKYPILIDFLAVAKDDAGQAFKAVRDLAPKN
jgi:hypothetical protein